MAAPLISVIVPVYNVAAYIEKCIVSILEQTYTNYEIILIDDCATDNSVEVAIACLIENKFTNYRLLKHTVNGGAAVARNTGLAAANGEYIYFMDNDDYAENTILEKLSSVLDNHDVDIAVCNYWRVIAETGEKIVEFKTPLQGAVDPIVAIDALFNEREHAYVWRNLYRKQVLKNIQFAQNIVYEDMMTLPLMWAAAKRIYFIPDFLYNYVKRKGSVITSWRSIDRYYDITKYMQRNEQYFRTHSQLKPLYKGILVYHYTMLRNFALQAAQGEKGFLFYKSLLDQFRNHISYSSLLKVSKAKHLKLILQLIVLKTGAKLFWKKFASVNQEVVVDIH